MKTFCFGVYALFLTAGVTGFTQDTDKMIKIGMIGLDTSHATAFTKILNSGEVPGGKVVAGVAQSSPDIESSHTRVDQYVKTLTEDWGLKIYDTIEEMLPHVDVVMVESVDGRPHLAQAKPAIEAGKLVFIDKPMSNDLEDVLAIFELAEKHNTTVWSASNLRYHEGVVKAATADVGELTAAISYGPASLEPNHLDLAWYGIHPTEALFTVMGPGCKSVQRTHTEGTDIVTGLWEGDKIGTVMGIRKAKRAYGIKVFGTKAIIEENAGGAYPQLMVEVIKFFQTGKAPVSPEETIELFAFMKAADMSKEKGGAVVTLEEAMAAAKGEK